MKERFYFQHDYEAQNDPKIIAMKSEYGAAGYGLYWSIIESLHSNEHHKLPTKEWQFLAIAKQNYTELNLLKTFVEDCVKKFELLVSDDNFFWSERVMRNFEIRGEISLKRSEAGKLGAIAKQNKASAKQNLANSSKEKKRKGKDNTISDDIDTNKEKYKKENFSPLLVSLPFSSPAFKSSWESWCKHKSEIKNPITEQAAKLQLKKLEDAGENNAVRMIEKAIENGWKSVFPLNSQDIAEISVPAAGNGKIKMVY